MDQSTQHSHHLAERQTIETTNNTETTQESGSQFIFPVAFICTVVIIAGIFFLAKWFFVVYLPRNTRKMKKKRKFKSVISYLQNFNIEDIDLRRAPTGGFHGTYLNNLADGINKSSEREKRNDSNSESSDTTSIEVYDEDPPIIIDLDLEANARQRGNCGYHAVDRFQRRSSLTRSNLLFMDATASIPYLGESNQYDGYVDEFGLTSQDFRDDMYPWRVKEDETI